MATSRTSFKNLAPQSLAHIFAFLPPEERVRSERVSREWRELVRKYGWIGFTRSLKLDKQEFIQRGDKALAKYRALVIRCAPYLHELCIPALGQYSVEVEHWAKMRNLRHLRFDACVSSDTLHAIAENLTRLQGIYFSDFDWRSVAGLRDLLRVDNASLQALRLPVPNRSLLRLPALPSSLRSLNISFSGSSKLATNRISELLELAASCCPQLAILMLPIDINVGETILAKLARFERLFYLCLSFDTAYANPFGNSLAKIGTQLNALFLGTVDSRLLQLVATHCPELEHISFDILRHGAEGLLSAMQSVFQLARLRSVSIYYPMACIAERDSGATRTQLLTAIRGLNTKGNSEVAHLEYLHLSPALHLPVEFIKNLINENPKLRKLTCSIQRSHPGELGQLKTLLQSMDGPLELELFWDSPPGLKMGKNNRIWVCKNVTHESISQPMLRHFWTQAVDSMPDLIELDD